MPALLSALIFLLFAGMVSNPAPTPPGDEFIPGHGEPARIDCIPADASQGTPSLYDIPKPHKTNVTFVNTPPCFLTDPPPQKIIDTWPDYNCAKNFWNPTITTPDKANYVLVADNATITEVWPDEDTTRLAKQKLPDETPADKEKYDPIRDQIYRATCNDWCQFYPDAPNPNARRDPPLPYGGTFFCDFIFQYMGQNIVNPDGSQSIAERKYIDRQVSTPGGPPVTEKYPDDTNCNKETYADCPVFNILIREGAPVPEFAGGAAPGSEVTPLRCDLINATPTPQANIGPIGPILASLWPETASAQTAPTFISLVGDHAAKGEWMLDKEQVTLARKIKKPKPDDPKGREKIPEPQPILFREKEYEAFFNLIIGAEWGKVDPTLKILYLVENGLIEQADAARDSNTPMAVPYLEFRRSPDIRPTGRTLQLGTFPIVTARGWWELFPKESKPAIYLYPKEPTALNVKLGTKGELIVSDPPYDEEEGWNVLAHPDGSLETLGVKTSGVSDGHRTLPDVASRYPYLYYEAVLDRVRIKPTGFIIAGRDLRSYFTKTLPKLGLNAKETADFIQYWMSRLDESQPYYFIHYLSEEQIESLEPLTLRKTSGVETSGVSRSESPDVKGKLVLPDTLIRIRPYFKLLSAKEANQLQINPQQLPTPPARKGFTLVEWGGILVD